MISYLLHCPQPPSTVIFFILSIETHCERIHHISLPHTVPSAQGICWVLELELDYRTLDYLSSGPLDYWTTELLDYWTSKLLDFELYWTFAPLNNWATELQNYWNKAPKLPDLRPSDFKTTKLFNYWTISLLDFCKKTGFQDFWTSEPLNY